MNSLGMTIYEQDQIVIKGTGRLNIDLGAVPKGIFTIKIKSGEYTAIRKIIISN